MASKVYLKFDGTYGTGIDLKKSHRGDPFLANMKKAASQLANPDHRSLTKYFFSSRTLHVL